tara:strand:- start:79 stop:1131 length:1053 start_codon:yes stop_codon:yes gene_type:complete
MNRLDTKLTFSDPFGSFKPQIFNFCTELTIDSSYNNLTDTAEVVIPKKLRYLKEDGSPVDSITRGDDPLFKIGDKASISIGYDSKLTEGFRGFISGIRQKFPIRFKLEDEVYKLKKFSVTVSLNNPTLDDLLGEIMPLGVLYEVTAAQNLGKFRITNATAAEVLNELRKKHGIYSFFRDSVMYIGLAVNPSLQKTHRFEFQTPQLITGDSLTYVDATERKIKVICKSIADDNTTLEATAGDSDGEIRTLYFNNYTLKDLQSTADRLAEEYRYSGYDGFFTIFATPLVNHGDIVELINRQIPEQSGGYIVIRVVTRCGWSIGGRQDVYIKQKIYDLIDNGSGKFIQKKISE